MKKHLLDENHFHMSFDQRQRMSRSRQGKRIAFFAVGTLLFVDAIDFAVNERQSVIAGFNEAFKGVSIENCTTNGFLNKTTDYAAIDGLGILTSGYVHIFNVAGTATVNKADLNLITKAGKEKSAEVTVSATDRDLSWHGWNYSFPVNLPAKCFEPR